MLNQCNDDLSWLDNNQYNNFLAIFRISSIKLLYELINTEGVGERVELIPSSIYNFGLVVAK